MGEFSIKRNVFTLKERKNADFQDGMHYYIVCDG